MVQWKSHCSGANPFNCITERRQKSLTSGLELSFLKKWDVIKNGCEFCYANRCHSLRAGSSWFPLTLLELLDHMLLSHTCSRKASWEVSGAVTWLCEFIPTSSVSVRERGGYTVESTIKERKSTEILDSPLHSSAYGHPSWHGNIRGL